MLSFSPSLSLMGKKLRDGSCCIGTHAQVKVQILLSPSHASPAVRLLQPHVKSRMSPSGM